MAHDAKNVWAAVVWVCYLKSFFVRYNISLANNLNANHIRAMDEYDRKRMKLMMSLTQTSKAYKTVADKRVSGFGLSQAMAMPAVMISRMGNHVRLSDVAEWLDLAPSSLVRVMDQLSEAGLLVRIEDGNDRRAKILALTEAGMQKVDMIEQAFAPFRRELLKDVTEADIEACQRVLDALGKAVKCYNGLQKQ